MRDLTQFLSIITSMVAVVGLVLMVVLHVLLAQALANDVDRLHERGRKPRFLGSVGWAFAALTLRLVTVAFYWVVHYSTLRDVAHDRSLTEM
ncbi:MAG: hypothetical protein SGI72_05025 [Planctomycetota bacterium]|nr:hypothetical protein [Planctomycetota bacterium]